MPRVKELLYRPGGVEHLVIPFSSEAVLRLRGRPGIVLRGSHQVRLVRRPDGIHDLMFTKLEADDA